MTDDRNVTTGLTLLAEEAEIQQIDTYAVIAAATARTRNRRLGAASALSTLAVAGVMVATMGSGGVGNPAATGDPSTVATSDDGWIKLEEYTNSKLTQQFVNVLPEVIPARFTFESIATGPNEAALVPYGFAPNETLPADPAPTPYTSWSHLRDAEGVAAMDVTVTKRPAGSPLEHLDGWPIGPCAEGEQGCSRHELPDGTVAAVQLTAQRNVLTAQRPDGTYIQVVTSPYKSGRPAPPLTKEELLKFATVFTY